MLPFLRFLFWRPQKLYRTLLAIRRRLLTCFGVRTLAQLSVRSPAQFAYAMEVCAGCSAASESSSNSSDGNYHRTDESESDSFDVSPSDKELATSSDSECDEWATSEKCARRDDAKWIKGDFSPSVFTFDATHSGQVPSSALPPDAKEIDYFKLFFDEGLVQQIVMETNKQANEKLHESRLPRKSQLRSWLEIDVGELYCFLAVVFLMGLVRKNTLREY